MSTILKALRRVEEAHGADQPKPALEGDWLGDGPEGATPPEPDELRQAPRPLFRAWPLVASAVAGFALVLSGAWLWSQRPADAAPTSPEPVAVVAAAIPTPEPEPVADYEAEPAVPANVSAEAVNGVQQRLRKAAERAAEAPPAAAADPVVPAIQAPDPAPVAPTPTPLVAIPEPAPEPARAAPPPRAPKPAAAKPPAAKPDRSELVAVIPPPPEIRIERTRWHPTPQKRTARVRIAGVVHDVRESDDIDGLRVVEIRPSTVVFMHEGVRIERKPGG